MLAARTWIELSRSALTHNLKVLRSVLGRGSQIAPVIKSNAYGHGLTEIASLLRSQLIWGVCVAYGQEALALRKSGWTKPILVLSYWKKTELSALVRSRIELVVWDFISLRQLVESRLVRQARFHLKIDTGTTRIGFQAKDLNTLSQFLVKNRIQPAGIFSHLANSEERASQSTLYQINYFTTLVKKFKVWPGKLHLACTAAALRYPESRLDLIRPGIGVYGLWPSQPTRTWAKRHFPRLTLKPVLRWKTRVSQVKLIKAGTAVGYGSTFKARRRMQVAILPVGYSDGFGRGGSNRAWVMINNERAPVIGRISMNLTAVGIVRGNVQVGDEAMLIGPGIEAETLGGENQTIHYEIVSRLSPLIPRQIVK